MSGRRGRRIDDHIARPYTGDCNDRWFDRDVGEPGIVAIPE